jgi:hypothetical protein
MDKTDKINKSDSSINGKYFSFLVGIVELGCVQSGFFVES